MDFVGVLRTAGIMLFGYLLGLYLLKKYDKPKSEDVNEN